MSSGNGKEGNWKKLFFFHPKKANSQTSSFQDAVYKKFPTFKPHHARLQRMSHFGRGQKSMFWMPTPNSSQSFEYEKTSVILRSPRPSKAFMVLLQRLSFAIMWKCCMSKLFWRQLITNLRSIEHAHQTLDTMNTIQRSYLAHHNENRT